MFTSVYMATVYLVFVFISNTTTAPCMFYAVYFLMF